MRNGWHLTWQPAADALFGGKENVIEGIFEKLEAVHSELIEKAG